MRRLVALSTALAAGLMFLGGVFVTGSATAKGGAVKVKISDARQSSAKSKGIQVKVTGRKGATVSISVKSNSFDEGTKNAAKKRKVKLGRKGSASVRIPLNGSIKKGAGTCAARTFTVTAKSGKKKTSARASMTRNLGPCKVKRLDLSKASHCDFIAQPKQGFCMLPFPNDFHTRRDSSSPTGKRINFDNRAMPRNNSDKVMEASDYNYSDGFSHGQSIVLRVPGVDSAAAIEANGFVGLDRLSRYAEPSQKAVVIDAKTGKRWPIWVQVDAKAGSDQNRSLMISPSTNFDPKGRYIVALRNLVDATGKAIQAPDGFRYLRDQIPSKQKPVNDRRSKFEGIFKTLKKAGIKRSSLYLAWDFTTSSNENNYARALHMRDEAFEELGDTTMADQIVQGDAPEFEVTTVNSGVSSTIGRRIRGTYTVPCFLTGGARAGQPVDCGPGGTMDLDPDGMPKRFGDYEANFDCTIPPVGLQPGAAKLRPYVYGHGLVGTASQVTGGVNGSLTEDHQMIACATDEIGMASEDLVSIAGALGELSNFKVVPDRLQQGLLNELFLARLMYHAEGFGTHPAFQDGDGTTAGDSVIRNDHVYYVGASQGGIMGGPLTALSPDFIQSALIVGAMNYSTLLTRSSNWATYEIIMNSSYDQELLRPLLFSLIQMLWDRGEPNGYSHVMTDNPPPNTPAHNVTMQIALGDHQVSNFASDVQARTIGAKTNIGTIDERRWPNYEGLWNIPRIQPGEYPYAGNNIIYWDGGPLRANNTGIGSRPLIGTGVSPYANIAPNEVDNRWEDPHGAPRGASGPISMMAEFLKPNGAIPDVCGPNPCLGDGWDGDYDSVTLP
jgi:hypothetical protein